MPAITPAAGTDRKAKTRPQAVSAFSLKSLLKKALYRLFKNVQMQGPRNPEP
jgi:hypothetical protein